MRQATYEFESVWELVAPPRAVFQALRDYKRYPDWWSDVRSVDELEAGDEDSIGMVVRYVVGSPLAYSLGFNVKVERIDEPTLIATRASGDLVGTGVWRLSESLGITTARCAWTVATAARWMNVIAPIARPLFSWAHSRVMARGARGLAYLLGIRLISVS